MKFHIRVSDGQTTLQQSLAPRFTSEFLPVSPYHGGMETTTSTPPLLATDPELLKHLVASPRFDLYKVTRCDGGTHHDFLDVIEAALGTVGKIAVTGNRFYDHRLNLTHDGRTFGHVAWGGINAMYPMIEVSGAVTPVIVEGLQQSMLGRYQVPCFHSCGDFLGGRTTFLRLKGLAEAVQRIPVRGAKPRLVPGYDERFPQDVWRFRLGSAKGTHIGVYEKGREVPEDYDVETVRTELRATFDGAGKRMVAALDAHDAWGVTHFTQRFASVLFDADVHRQGCRKVTPNIPADESIEKAGRQYGNAVLDFIDRGHSTTELGDLMYAAAVTKQAIRNAKRPNLQGGTNTRSRGVDLVLDPN